MSLAVLGPGETVGEMGYFSSGVRSASARARERTELLEIAFADVPRCLEAAPRVALPLLDIVTARLRETDLRYQIDVLRRRSVERSLEGLSSILDLSDAWKMRVGIEELIDRIVQTASRVMKAERASLFLVDETTGDLWSQVAEGEGTRVLRVPKGSGIAGWVAQHGDLLNIPDAYRDDRFNREMDRKTGFRTKSILCGPVRNLQGRIIGVVQVMNKKGCPFDPSDEPPCRAFAYQAAIAVENFHLYRRVVASHGKMAVLLDVASALSETLDLPRLIQRVIAKTTEVLECDRGSLFLFDRGKGELWSMEARGAELAEIRFPASVGLAGHTATTGEILNVPDAYEDARFNPRFDRETGYRTKTVLCAPVRDRDGAVQGVVQAINKHRGRFNAEDEELLKAMASQMGVALQNASLHRRTTEMRDYLESVQESISNAILSLDRDWRVVTANRAAQRLFGRDAGGVQGADVRELLGTGGGAHIAELVGAVYASDLSLMDYDIEVEFVPGRKGTVNANLVPLYDEKRRRRGAVLVLEDITREKRVKSTLTRYMAKDIVDRMLQDPDKQGLGGTRGRATVLFSDIREFTTLAEAMTAEQTMDFLNAYFTVMVDEVFEQRGVLDKFMGDALLAVFGVPYAHPDDAVRAVRTALRMRERLKEFNAVRAARGEPAVRMGVGINTGDVISGNMGSEKRMDFTVIGDGVNTCSRLEGLTKLYGADLIVSETTAAEVAELFTLRPLDRVRVKGRAAPLEIHEVLGDRDSPASAAQARFAEGLAAYRRGAFEDARAIFLAGAGADPPSAIFAQRCEHLLKAPPPPTWDGVWLHTTK